MSAGVVTAQGPGVPTSFAVKQGAKARFPAPLFTSSGGSDRGVLVKWGADSGGQPTCVLATTGDLVMCGVLGDVFFDPTAVPAAIAAQTWGVGIYQVRAINEPATVWYDAVIDLPNITGSVATGDYLKPTTNGFFITNTSTNPLTNGAIVAVAGNAVSGGLVTASINVA